MLGTPIHYVCWLNRAMMNSFNIVTIGCKVNQCESARIARDLVDRGLYPAKDSQSVSLCIVNTCCVTAASEHKSRKAIRKAARCHPDAKIVVTGCYANIAQEKLKKLQHVTTVLSSWDAGKLPFLPHPRSRDSSGFLAWRSATDSLWAREKMNGRTRAFLKVQDGCDNYCTYCIVPQARGKPRSIPLQTALDEARTLAAQGFKEIVLCGVRLGAYGADEGLHNASLLIKLIKSIEELEGIERVRLSSIEPNEITEELIEYMADSKKLCPHLHIPLQSGDDEILRRMNRKYSVEYYLDLIERLKKRLNNPSLTTDVMIGFPGETQLHFENTLNVCLSVGFSRIHVFSFSPRPGTPAALFNGRPSPAEVAERKSIIKTLGLSLAYRFKQQFVGRTVRVLVECIRSNGQLSGYTERYVQVRFCGRDSLINSLVNVRVENISSQFVEGCMVGNDTCPTLSV